MKVEVAKKELVSRYKYLYENAYLILAPYMYEQTQEEYEAMVRENPERYWEDVFVKPLIYLNINRVDSINKMFEEFLLSDKFVIETGLYKFVEANRNNKEYLEKVRKGLVLLDKSNEGKKGFFHRIDIWEILNKTWDYVKEQSGDVTNKKNKLLVLDEYYKILRYRNNGKIYTSGRELNLHDCDSLVIDIRNRKPLRDRGDIGVRKNAFIKAIVAIERHHDNDSIFTEGEKQEIYLEYHDELPWDMEIVCELEEEYVKTMIDTRLKRPGNTYPCGDEFLVKEEEIFVNPDDTLYRYYQVCPHCGYITYIPKEFLTDGIKQRIEERCSKDDKLFRKMFLYSELFSLDKLSTKGQKRILKK